MSAFTNCMNNLGQCIMQFVNCMYDFFRSKIVFTENYLFDHMFFDGDSYALIELSSVQWVDVGRHRNAVSDKEYSFLIFVYASSNWAPVL